MRSEYQCYYFIIALHRELGTSMSVMKPHWKKLQRFVAPRLDIPFSRDDANRFLPWFIALMVFLTALFLAGGITIGEIAHHKRQDISQWVTVQLPASEANKGSIAAISALLAKQADDGVVNRRSREETANLIAPWFGKGEIVDALPLPILFEIKWENKDPQQVERLRQQLLAVSSAVELDDHEHWVAHYLRFVRLIEWGAYIMAAIVLAAAVVMIIFTSKTALKLHHDAVWLLHSVGAVDYYIARQFQFNAFLLGMRGALIGIIPAVVLFFIIAIFTNQFDAPLLPALPITGWHIASWLLLPVVTGLLAMFVARKTVLAMLQKMT